MRLLCCVAALALTGCVGAMRPPPATLPGQAAAPTAAVADRPLDAVSGAYVMDARHTSLIWRVRHMNMSLFTARFDKVAGTLDFNAAAPAQSKLSASVAAASVNTGLKEGKDATFDSEIAKVLGAEKTPQITFVSKSITRTGEKTGFVTGELTLNGVTKAQKLDITFENYASSTILSAKPRLAFSAHGVVKRSDWDAGSMVFNLFAGDDVEIIIQTEFEKA